MNTFFYSARQAEEQCRSRQTYCRLDSGEIKEYTEMCSEPNPNKSLRLQSGTIIPPHTERWSDSVCLGTGFFHHATGEMEQP